MSLIMKLCQFKFHICAVGLFTAITYCIIVILYFSFTENTVVIDVIEHTKNDQIDNINNNYLFLDDISNSSVKPKDDQNIFFLDTFRMQPKYSKFKSQIIGKRQACAIESAALLNPHLNIYAVYITRETHPKLKITPELLALMKYSNLKFVSVYHNSFPIGTPLGGFFINNQDIHESEFVVAHMSDAYRLLILWKYGGVYYDTDVISLKSVESAPKNFACDDGEGDIVANGIIRCDSQKGRKFTEMFMKYMIENYEADEWGTNGPIVITKVINEICKTESIKEMIEMGNCDGFHVLPKKICYPVPWTLWRRIFNEKRVRRTMRMMDESMTLHLWNDLSKKRRIEVELDSVFNRVAKEKCPNVYKVMVEGVQL